MSDIVDRANAREEEMLADALGEQARRSGLRGKTVNDSAVDCRVCGDPIPYKRRRALPGVQTCVYCQTDLENSMKVANGR